MLSFPNCKINIGLYVTSKRSDGYHDLQTVFYPVNFYDVLEIVPSSKISLHLSGLPVQGNREDNLVVKAYEMLRARFPDKISGVDVYLHKVIPMGAGLGGGSADGAYMLKLLNDYFDLQLSAKELGDMALILGSDCPFFIKNSPQFATGRGEVMQPVALDLSGYSMQVVVPDIHVSTAGAFKLIEPAPAPVDLSKIAEIPISDWRHLIENQFEKPIFAQHPELATIKDFFYQAGAIYASMTGSGSGVYGIFPKGMKADFGADLKHQSFYIN